MHLSKELRISAKYNIVVMHMDNTAPNVKIIKISSSCVASFRHGKHGDKVRTAIANTLKINDPDGFARHGKYTHPNPDFERSFVDENFEGVDIDDAKHNIKMSNSRLGYATVKRLQQDFLNTRMCEFGNEEETRSRPGVERLLAIKKWVLTKFQDKKQYTKTFPCEIDGEQITIIVSGRLDGECAHRNTNAVVEIKNRVSGLIFKPRDAEECQVRLYMELTGYEHGFLFERHVDVDETENISVVPFAKKDKPDFINDTICDKNFKKNLGKVLRCLNDEQEFANFFAPTPNKEQRRGWYPLRTGGK